jgi:flagellar hook-length control protein FliK
MEKPIDSQRAGRRFCPSRGINRQVLPGLKGSVPGSAPRLIAELREFRLLNQWFVTWQGVNDASPGMWPALCVTGASDPSPQTPKRSKLPSIHAVTRAASIQADKRSAGLADEAGAATGSVQDLFAKLLGGAGSAGEDPIKLTGVKSAKAAGEEAAVPPPAGPETTALAVSALSGLAITVPPAPAVPSGLGLQTTPVVTSEPDADASTSSEGSKDPALPGSAVAAGFVPGATGETGEIIETGATAASSAPNTGVPEAPVAKTTLPKEPLPPAAAAKAPVVATTATPTSAAAGGALNLVVESAALSAAQTAATAITSALGVATNAAAKGPAITATSPAGAKSRTGAVAGTPANALAGLQEVSVTGATPASGATAAFDASGLEGGEGIPLPVEGGEANSNGLPVSTSPQTAMGQRAAHPASPLMAAALSFAERLKADQDALEADVDVLGTALPSSSARVDSASLSPATAQGPVMGREVPVPLPMLASEIARQAERGKRSFDIRLDPAELGKVRVKLELGQEGEVRAHLVVERKETLDLLQRDQRVLERALQDAGLSLGGGGLQFSLSGGGQQGFGEQGSFARSNRSQTARAEAEPIAGGGPVPPPTPRARPGGIDVKI